MSRRRPCPTGRAARALAASLAALALWGAPAEADEPRAARLRFRGDLPRPVVRGLAPDAANPGPSWMSGPADPAVRPLRQGAAPPAPAVSPAPVRPPTLLDDLPGLRRLFGRSDEVTPAQSPTQPPEPAQVSSAPANTPAAPAVYAAAPAYRWYGWGATSPAPNPAAPDQAPPQASKAWFEQTGATAGAFPASAAPPAPSASPANAPPSPAAGWSDPAPARPPATSPAPPVQRAGNAETIELAAVPNMAPAPPPLSADPSVLSQLPPGAVIVGEGQPIPLDRYAPGPGAAPPAPAAPPPAAPYPMPSVRPGTVVLPPRGSGVEPGTVTQAGAAEPATPAWQTVGRPQADEAPADIVRAVRSAATKPARVLAVVKVPAQPGEPPRYRVDLEAPDKPSARAAADAVGRAELLRGVTLDFEATLVGPAPSR